MMCSGSEGEDKDRVRRNGLETPYSMLQLLAWALYALLLVYFFALLYPLLWGQRFGAYAVPITAAMCISAAIALICGIITSVIDPADLAVLKQTPADNTDRVLCYLCDVRVHRSSRHCRVCNKCVENFDHHCQWLNSCVGKKNYRYFLALVSAVTFETMLLLVLTVLYVAEAFGAFGDISERGDDAFGSTAGKLLGLRIILVVSAAILTPLVGMVLQLAGFHIMLVYYGLTTYDYIIGAQKRAREEKLSRTKVSDSCKKNSNQPKTISQSHPNSPTGDANNSEVALSAIVSGEDATSRI